MQITLSNGLVVRMPSALTGAPEVVDPEVKRLQEELAEIDSKLESGDIDIPPEGQRSPSPEPTYDRYGVRLNTREVGGPGYAFLRWE